MLLILPLHNRNLFLREAAEGIDKAVIPHHFSKADLFRPDWRNIEANVPCGISFLGEGTITVLSSLRNFLWLPVWSISMNPFFISTAIICRDECSLGINLCFSD